MRLKQQNFGVDNSPRISCLLLVTLLLTSTLINIQAQDSSLWQSEDPVYWNNEIDFFPDANQSFINTTESSMIQVPANHTFTSGQLEVAPIWQEYNSTDIIIDSSIGDQWSGTHNDTVVAAANNELRLKRNSSFSQLTDFETTTVVPSQGWLGSGINDQAWTIQSPSNNTPNTQSNMNLPIEGINGSGFLSTLGEGDLSSSQYSCIQSPQIDTPRIINNFSLSFDQWLALDSSDAVWIEIFDLNNSWTPLMISSGGMLQTELIHAPNLVWNGESNSWNRVEIGLDSYLSSSQSVFFLRFCFETSSIELARGGWFIDDLVLFNQGGNQGALFHGNLLGNYLPNANSKYVIPLEFSSISSVDEIEVSMNWDIQGYLDDYITVELSIDNGTSWNTLSGRFGIPGTGIWHNGNLYYGESKGWIPLFFNLNFNLTNTPTFSETLLRFSVITDSSINFGGSSSSDWEGIAIDNIVFHSGRQSSNPSSFVYRNFSSQPNLILGSSDGWLENYSFTQNQWQWTDTMGLDYQSYTNFTFDYGYNLPAGWAIQSIDDRQWQIGTTSNSSGYGPGYWPSGQQGAGIYLNSSYGNEMLTHLYSPEYLLPIGSSSRLSFKSWVCTEANWDGGAISVSTDGGINWWYLPPSIGNFHDQISTINTNSPFYGEGIFDGSTINGGCSNTIHPFVNKTFDTSNLSGEDIRFRYSFFSDQLLEYDGWYIDDAGVEIDVFESQGSWISDIFSPDSTYGWGSVDGFVKQPVGTSVTFDVLDMYNNSILGYTNRVLPIDIRLDPETYPGLRIKVNLETSDHLVSPSVELLSIGGSTYFDSYHLQNIEQNDVYFGHYEELYLSSDFEITTQQPAYLVIQTPSFCPHIGNSMTSIGDNISLFSSSFNIESTYYDGDSEFRQLNFSNDDIISQSLSDEIQITLLAGQEFTKFSYTPFCAKAPENPSIKLGLQNQSVFSWPNEVLTDYFGLSTNLESISSGGVTSSNNNGSLELDVTDGQIIEISYRIIESINSTNSLTNNQIPMSMIIELSSQSNSSLNYFFDNKPFVNTTVNQSVVQERFTSQNLCPNLSFPDGEIYPGYGLAKCTVKFRSNGNSSLKVSNLLAIPEIQQIELQLSDSILNSIRNQSYQGDDRSLIHIPMNVETTSGSIGVNLSTNSYLHQIDRIISISEDRWLPEQTIVVNTSHVRFNPVIFSEINYQLDNVRLIVSSSPSFEDTILEIEAIDLYSEKQFILSKGSDLVSIDLSQSSVICHHGFCQIQWALTSNWNLDDIDDIHWMVISQTTSGLETGPALVVRQTSFNEIENDLEIIQFSAFDGHNALHDWTDADWPFHLQSNESINVNGQVRFQGISNKFIEAGQAEIEVRIQAVPPKNISGGLDTWPEQPVNWSLSNFVEVGHNGYFSASISTPNVDEIPSNTYLEISAHINRNGPISSNSQTSFDMTAEYQKTRVLFDIEAPRILSLSILDPGGISPADGHIWMAGQDIPLRLELSDVEGLSPMITIWSWSEYKDDANSDGVMDAEEYVSTSLTVNTGSTKATVDLPILSWFDIRGPFESGRLSVVIELEDLAGNRLLDGGDYGSELDLATILVQNQYQTYLDVDSIGFDLIDGQIFPGYMHNLSFSITDANGIYSIDKFEFAILGRDSDQQCFIHYSPRFAEVNFDKECFVIQPEVIIYQQSGLQVWDIFVSFRVSWDVPNSINGQNWTPSLKVFDEGQDLYLGLSLLTMFEWDLNQNIDLTQQEIRQNGWVTTNNETKIWTKTNELIELELYLSFTNYSIPVEYLSNNYSVNGLIDNINGNILINTTISQDGKVVTQLFSNETFSDSDMFELEINLLSPQLNKLALLNYEIYFDNNPPLLSLNLKDLLKIDSNKLSDLQVSAIVSDEYRLNKPQLVVKWYFTNNGTIIDGTEGETMINSTEFTLYNTYFNQSIDISPFNANLLDKDSEVVIWFEAFDNSGFELTGLGTSNEPILPKFNWVDFEPKLDIISVESDSPIFGQDLEIMTRIVNLGQLNGTVEVNLKDNDGKILEARFIEIEPGKWTETNWNFEVWTTEQIIITIELVNYSQSRQIEINDIEEFDSSNRELNCLIGLVLLLIFLLVGGFGFAYYRSSKELEQYTKLHRQNVSKKRYAAPPRPSELDNIGEEE